MARGRVPRGRVHRLADQGLLLLQVSIPVRVVQRDQVVVGSIVERQQRHARVQHAQALGMFVICHVQLRLLSDLLEFCSTWNAFSNGHETGCERTIFLCSFLAEAQNSVKNKLPKKA